MAVRLYIGAALALAVAAGGALRQALILARWPKAEGTVVAARVAEDVSRNSRRGSARAIYQPVVDFRYDRDGVAHVGRAAASSWYTDVGEARAALAGYPVGSRHPVRYNPAAPDELRYDAGSLSGFRVPLLALAVGVGLFAVGFGLGRAFGRRGPAKPAGAAT